MKTKKLKKSEKFKKKKKKKRLKKREILFNPLPYIPILGSSSSTANKNLMSKIWTNGVQLSE